MQKDLTCINCPIGCNLNVTLENGEVCGVGGAGCKKGEEYAKMECVNPIRIVTSTVRLNGSILKMLPVKTKKPIPKNKIYECILALKNVETHTPIYIGDVIIKNVCNTKIDVIATRCVTK